MRLFDNILGRVGYVPAQEVQQSLQTMQTEITELRSNLSNPEQWFMDWASGGIQSAGVAVTKDTVLAVTAVHACCRILSNTIASLSLGLYRQLPNGDIEAVEDLPEYDVVCSEPNSLYDKFTFDSTTMFHETLQGNSYSKLYFGRGGRISQIEIMRPDCVQVYYEQGKLFYVYDNPYSGKREILADWEVLHFKGHLSEDGLVGKSPLQMAKSTFGSAIAANNFMSSMYKGGYMRGIVEDPGKLTDDQIVSLRRSIMTVMQDHENTSGIGVLTNGRKFHQLTISPKDLEYIAASKLTVLDVCRIFGVPPHLVAEMDRATFSNIEHQSLEFVRDTIRPIVKKREGELNRRILRMSDKKNLFYRYNIDSLLRGDTASRAAFIVQMLQNGVFNIDEARRFENMNQLPEGLGKAHYRPLNMVEVGKEPDPQQINNDPAATGQNTTDDGTPQASTNG